MASTIEARSVSVIIPTYNGAKRIGECLEALTGGTVPEVEVLVVDDGSTDNTVEVVERYPGVRVILQPNSGPAAARNHGAREAHGEILMFTDDDCVPTPTWLASMLAPFEDPEVVGAKGVYRTSQSSLVARFVQIEYEDRYRLMRNLTTIDFIDTYSAAYRRERFLEMGGYDDSFPVACAEDVELSYRMSARHWKMKFAPLAMVYHTHPDTLSWYLRKKYKFAFWRVFAVRKNPRKAVKDSHTPQLMKLQLLLAPASVLAAALDVTTHPPVSLLASVIAAFGISTLPFALRAYRKDAVIGLLSPGLLATRACAQFLGVASGSVQSRRVAPVVTSHEVSTQKQVTTFHSEYIVRLRRLLSAEQQSCKLLQQMSDRVNDQEFKAALRQHMVQTEVHIARLIRLLVNLSEDDMNNVPDNVMSTLSRSVDHVIDETRKGPMRDAALQAIARTVEHYEIASYCTVCDWANHLELAGDYELLNLTLREEKETEGLLSTISPSRLVSQAA